MVNSQNIRQATIHYSVSKIAILIPTWNNNQYLLPCVNSILAFTGEESHLYIVNNGDPENMKGVQPHDRITFLQQNRNLGWEGGLKAGLSESTEEFVIFMNDDTYVPMASKTWANDMLAYFKDPKVAAVGPSSNVVMGAQSIFAPLPALDATILKVKFLIGFCFMVRRSALDEVGGVDDSLPGGDDFDLSIRLRKSGHELLAARDILVYHHGFKTGERVNGGPNVSGGWNSVEMTEKTNFGLMRKHGLRSWMDAMNDQVIGVYGLH